MADVASTAGAEISDDERLARRAKIAALQDHLQNEIPPEEHIALRIEHFFADGVYIREMHAPAGTLIIGELHKRPHLTSLVKGRIVITTEEGAKTLEAPLTLVATPGMKRVGYCETDVIWQSIHHVGEERDLAVIFDTLIAKSFDDPALTTADVQRLVEEAA